MHFGILEMIATAGFLTALECINFFFGRGSARTGAYSAPPDPLRGLRGPYTSIRGKGGQGRREEERGEKGNVEQGRGQPHPTPVTQIPGSDRGVLARLSAVVYC